MQDLLRPEPHAASRLIPMARDQRRPAEVDGDNLHAGAARDEVAPPGPIGPAANNRRQGALVGTGIMLRIRVTSAGLRHVVRAGPPAAFPGR